MIWLRCCQAYRRHCLPIHGDSTTGLTCMRSPLPCSTPLNCRLLLEAWSSLRSSLRHHGSDLLWEQGRPEALVGHLVALAVAAGSNRLQLYHYMQPGGRSAGLEDAVAAAFSAAAEEHGASAHGLWGVACLPF